MHDLARADDALLAERAADGDDQAFAVLVRRHERYVRGLTTRITGSTGDGDDAAQEAFITAWEQLPKLRDPGAVRSWLAQIAHRKALERLRARRPWVQLEDDADSGGAESGSSSEAAVAMSAERHYESVSAMTALAAVLERLPEAQRAAWVLKEMIGLSYDEIADRLDVPPSTVRGSLARARVTVMREMEEWR